MSTEIKSRVWQVQAQQNWIRTILIKQIVKEGDKVCQFYCKDGVDLGKWSRAAISRYVGIDPSQNNITIAKSKFDERGLGMESDFLVSNIMSENIFEKFENHPLMIPYDFDCVVCFNGLDSVLIDESAMRFLFSNVSTMLKNDGYFFGVMNDSSEIWSRAQKLIIQKSRGHDKQIKIQSKLYSITFETEEFSNIGCPYDYLLDGFKVVRHYLIHFPSFRRIANEYHLEVVSISNCNEFYEDYKKYYPELLQQLGVLSQKNKKGLISEQKEITGIYTNFVIQKREN